MRKSLLNLLGLCLGFALVAIPVFFLTLWLAEVFVLHWQ